MRKEGSNLQGPINQVLSCLAKLKVAQSCLTLCNPMDCGLPDSSVHGILQARILEWVAKPSSRRSSQRSPPPGDLPGPGIEPAFLTSPALAGRFFITSDTWEALSLGSCSNEIGWVSYHSLCPTHKDLSLLHPSYTSRLPPPGSLLR